MSTELRNMADRIRRCAEIVGSGNELSRRTGIPRRSLENYFTGREPQASQLAAIADAAQVSLDWLIRGQGAERLTSSVPPAQSAVDAPLFGRLTDAIVKLHKELGVAISPREQGEMIAERYSEIVAASADPDERQTMIKLVIQQLRKDIQAAAAKPGEGKHVA
ncbi:MAG: helix-turn-helix transcriptional regulator [Pseudomonadota bacterium]